MSCPQGGQGYRGDRVVIEVGHEGKGSIGGDGHGVGLEADRHPPDDPPRCGVDLDELVLALDGDEHVVSVWGHSHRRGQGAHRDRHLDFRRRQVHDGHPVTGVCDVGPGGHVGGRRRRGDCRRARCASPDEGTPADQAEEEGGAVSARRAGWGHRGSSDRLGHRPRRGSIRWTTQTGSVLSRERTPRPPLERRRATPVGP